MARRIVLGTAGHIDHGKTTLIRALTGIDTDRLKEEKKRGITIELGFAHLELDDGRTIGVVDVPGHERFVRNMVAGASGVDLVALVIAADEGVMPQTKEHIDICELLGVTTGVVVLTKVDMVEEDWLELVTEEVAEYLSGTFLKDAPMIPVSALTGRGLPELRRELTRITSKLEERQGSGPFRLPIDRAFTMKGFGSVVTGTSISGSISLGEPVKVYPSNLSARVRGLQVHGQEVEEVSSGLRTAVNLQGVELNELHRGEVVATPGSLTPTDRLDAKLKLLASAPRKLKNRAEVHLHIGTREFMARLIPMGHEELEPGQGDYVQLIIEEGRTACLPGDHFVIRASSPPVTIGGGVILSVAPPRRKRFTDETAQAFEVLENGSEKDKIAWLIGESRMLGLTRDRLAALTPLTAKELDKAVQELLSKREVVRYDAEAQRLAHSRALERITGAIEAFLTDYHRKNPLKAGPNREEIKTRLRLHADPKLITFGLSRLVAEEKVKAEADIIALAGHRVSLAKDQNQLKENILTAYQKGGITPPTLKTLADDLGAADLKPILQLLLNQGLLVKLKEELYYDPAALKDLKDKLVVFFKDKEEMTTQDFKDLTGVSRKFLIPLAEYFDREGVTIRVGEVRKLRKKLG